MLLVLQASSKFLVFAMAGLPDPFHDASGSDESVLLGEEQRSMEKQPQLATKTLQQPTSRAKGNETEYMLSSAQDRWMLHAKLTRFPKDAVKPRFSNLDFATVKMPMVKRKANAEDANETQAKMSKILSLFAVLAHRTGIRAIMVKNVNTTAGRHVYN